MTLSRGQMSNIIKFQLPCQFQRFLYQILCVFSQIKDTKHIRRDFLFCPLGHAPGVGLLGTGGTQGVKQFFFKHGHVAYQIDGDDAQNKMQVTFSS